MNTQTLSRTHRWVSCSREEGGHVAAHRHIIHKGGVTTACGSTASMPEVWRSNKTKPACPSCVTAHGGSKGTDR